MGRQDTGESMKTINTVRGGLFGLKGYETRTTRDVIPPMINEGDEYEKEEPGQGGSGRGFYEGLLAMAQQSKRRKYVEPRNAAIELTQSNFGEE